MITTTTLAAPTVLGLDLSLSGTGLAGNAGGGWTACIKPPRRLAGHERIAYIKGKIFDEYLNDINFVVVEGPSYGSQAGQQGHHERAGLWWLVTHTLWTCDISVLVMPPKSLKKYATGKGNAGKDLVLTEVVRRFTWFTGDNNEADALVLAAAGADWTGSPLVTMPATHRAALVALNWPSLEEAS